MPDSFGWVHALENTRRATFGRLLSLLGASEITPAAWDEVEALLLQADLGPRLAGQLCETLRTEARRGGLRRREEVYQALRTQLIALLGDPMPLRLQARPSVILVVGVNGSGKTTTIAKLARHLQREGKRVMLAAADTFRAAAVAQLRAWGDQLGMETLAGQEGSDPGAVAHDAAQAALARGADVLVVDTAGRLHTRYNLMQELIKVRRVLGKVIAGAPHETWLVLDATAGQNALAQARAFRDAVEVTGAILAKLDGSAKGGMAFAIQSELRIPLRFVGLGEGIEDLAEFSREHFVDGLLERETQPA